MTFRAASFGGDTLNERGILLTNASSTSPGRFVAPNTRTEKGFTFDVVFFFSLLSSPFFSCVLLRRILSDFRPSHSIRNSLFTLSITGSLLYFARVFKNASISSMKMMHGDNLRANENKARTFFSLSPNHLSQIELTLTLIKKAPDSFAKHF